MKKRWNDSAANFLLSLQELETGLARSTPQGMVTLYGTCYSYLGLHYLGLESSPGDELKRFVAACQDPESGLLIGPELVGFRSAPGVLHDRAHLLLHLTCAALPFCQQYGIELPYPIHEAHRFCDLAYLKRWMEARDWKQAWFEGNNILFVGQLLVYLRDVEKYPGAAAALAHWFEWLDGSADPATGLWGTNGFCSPMEAVYGGYHQLLVYYHQNHPLTNPSGLVDTVLKLQHHDGGFNPSGNAGACEDVDSVDILVNCYKRFDYRRANIRHALRRCLGHILSTQNPDGGFPYNLNQAQSHMGIPGTDAPPNVSCAFPTWFRIHTLALIAEILPNEVELKGISFRFNKALSMGWHSNPEGWEKVDDSMTIEDYMLKARYFAGNLFVNAVRILRNKKRKAMKILRSM